jgi:hypothetical protein
LSRVFASIVLTGIVSLCIPVLAAGASPSAAINQSIAAAIARAKGPGCSTPFAVVPGATVPVGIVKEGRVRVVLIGVCIDDQGPFVFALDTGASYSYVARSLATRLDLPASGPSVNAGVIGCRATVVQPVELGNWSAGGLVLDPQSVVAGYLGSDKKGLNVAGLLGSDVLARFNAVRIDYVNQTLAIESPEGVAPGATLTSVVGPVGQPTPFDLITAPRVDVGIDVLSTQSATVAFAVIRAAGRPWLFVIDTGSAFVVVGTTLAKAARLDTVSTIKLSATNCHSAVPIYASTRGLRLGRYILRPQELLGLPGNGTPLIAGLLGSTVLSRFGVLVVDYSDGRLLLSA